MKELIKKIVYVIILNLIVVCFLKISTVNVEASDVSIGYGFSYNDSSFDMKWKPKRTMNVERKSPKGSKDIEVIGIVTTNIGIATYLDNKESFQKDNINVVMIEATMSPKKVQYYDTYWFFGTKTNRWYEYGMAEDLTLSSELSPYVELMGYSPESKTTSTSYTSGVSLGADSSGKISAGISASQTFTEKALDINMLSDTSMNRFKVNFDYNRETFFNWNFHRNKYLSRESKQRATFTLGSDNKINTIYLDVRAAFTTSTDGKDDFWSTSYYKGKAMESDFYCIEVGR